MFLCINANAAAIDKTLGETAVVSAVGSGDALLAGVVQGLARNTAGQFIAAGLAGVEINAKS